MIGWTNMADGGINIQNNKAVIHVLAPIGSTINFLKDGITIVLKPDKSFVDITRNDFAHWYYSISPSNYGEWTVIATLGTDTASDTVIIDSALNYSIKLYYGLWLYYPGQTSGWTAVGWKAVSSQTARKPTKTYGNSTMTVQLYDPTSGGYTGVVYYDTPVDLTNISSIILTGNIVGYIDSGYRYNGLYVWDAVTTGYYDTGAVKKSVFTKAGDATLTIDVSSITGTKYVGVGIRRSDTNMIITINSIELVEA